MGDIGDPGNEEFWREQVEIDRWMDAGCPDVDDWLAEHKLPPRPPPKPRARPRRKASNALPPSELVHLYTLSKAQAGVMMGVSEDWIQEHVMPYVKTIREGRLVLIDAVDLQRFIHDKAGRG
jgi:hypothetical protein